MKIEVKGNLPEDYLKATVKKLKRLVRLPKQLEIYFLASESDGREIVRSIHKHARKTMRYVLLKERNSFAYNHKGRKIIVIPINHRRFLLKSQDALLGLLLHEVMHIKQQDKGMYKVIKKSFEATFIKNQKLLIKLKYPRPKLKSLFEGVGSTSILLLKDLFVNTEVIASGRAKYLLDYYRADLIGKKTCPQPVFYEKFKEAAKRDLDVITIAFEFEFALLSMILPFQKYSSKKAKDLMFHINHCYEMNVQDIARKCHELIYLYLNEFSYDEKFARRFFSAVFSKVYLLLV